MKTCIANSYKKGSSIDSAYVYAGCSKASLEESGLLLQEGFLAEVSCSADYKHVVFTCNGAAITSDFLKKFNVQMVDLYNHEFDQAINVTPDSYGVNDIVICSSAPGDLATSHARVIGKKKKNEEASIMV